MRNFVVTLRILLIASLICIGPIVANDIATADDLKWKICSPKKGNVLDTSTNRLSDNIYQVVFRGYKDTDDIKDSFYNFYTYDCTTKYLEIDKVYSSKGREKVVYENISTIKFKQSWKIDADIKCDEDLAYNLCRRFIGK